MGTTLTGTTPQDTYDSLIKVTDNGPLSGTAKYLSDGLGNDSVLALSTAGVGIGTNAPAERLEVAGSNVMVRINAAVNSFAQLGFYEAGSLKWNTYNDFNNDNYSIGNSGGTHLSIASAGNVGIGTSSPYAKLDVYANATNSSINVNHAVNSGTIPQYAGISFGAPTTTLGGDTKYTGGAGIQSVNTAVSGNETDLRFWTTTGGSPTERMRILAGGNVGIGTSAPAQKLSVVNGSIFTSRTDSSENIIISDGTTNSSIQQVTHLYLNSGGNSSTFGDVIFRTKNSFTEMARFTQNGLCFNGDSAAANALDDYEEGTWTMGISFGGGSTGVTYSSNTGTYTKVGRQVTVNGYVALSNKGSSTGLAALTGLPFTIPNSANHYSPANFWLYNITFANQFEGYGQIGGNQIFFQEITEAGAQTNLTNADFANNSEIMVSLTYFV